MFGRRGFENEVATVVLGLALALTALQFQRQLPAIPIASQYLLVQSIGFVVLVGLMPVAVYLGETAQIKLASSALLIAAVGWIGGLAVVGPPIDGLPILVGVGAVVALGGLGAAYATRTDTTIYLHAIGLLASLLYAFLAIVLGKALMVLSNLPLLVAFIVLTGVFGFYAVTIRGELRSARS
jgi:hypothetical protein